MVTTLEMEGDRVLAGRPGSRPGPTPFMRQRRYPSDTTDAEWALLAPLLPAPACGIGRGRPEKHPRREIVDGIRYLVDNGIKWRAMPADFPPWRTIYGFARRWAATGAISLIRDQLRRQARLASGKTPQAAAVITAADPLRDAGRPPPGSPPAGLQHHLLEATPNLILKPPVSRAWARSGPDRSR